MMVFAGRWLGSSTLAFKRGERFHFNSLSRKAKLYSSIRFFFKRNSTFMLIICIFTGWLIIIENRILIVLCVYNELSFVNLEKVFPQSNRGAFNNFFDNELLRQWLDCQSFLSLLL